MARRRRVTDINDLQEAVLILRPASDDIGVVGRDGHVMCTTDQREAGHQDGFGWRADIDDAELSPGAMIWGPRGCHEEGKGARHRDRSDDARRSGRYRCNEAGF